MIPYNEVDCNKNNPGTGVVDCAIKEGIFKSAFLVTDPNWELTVATDTFDREYVLEQIMLGVFVPLMKSDSFANNTPDTTTQDYDGGIVRTVRNGKPMYQLNFDNGPLWHAAVSAYSGRSGLGMILIDDAGQIKLIRSVDKTKMFAMGLSDFNVPTWTPKVGDTNANTAITFQIANEVEYNTRPAYLTATAVGFDANTEIKGIIDVDIAGAGDISNGNVVVQVTAAMSRKFGVKGLTATDFRLVNNGTDAEITITSVTANPLVAGEYTIAATLTGVSSVTVSTYDADLDVTVARIGTSTQLFRGENTNITVAA